MPAPVAGQTSTTSSSPAADAPTSMDLPDSVSSSSTTAAQPVNVDATITAPSVSVKTDVFDVEISTNGATITSVLLDDYPVSIEQPDTPFTLMSKKPERFLVAQSGLFNADGGTAPVPTHETAMTVEATSYELGDKELSLIHI